MNDAKLGRFDSHTYARMYDEESIVSKRVKFELQPLLDEVAGNPANDGLFKEIFSDFKRRTAHENIIVKHMAERLFEDGDEVKDDLRAIFVYLGLVETYGSTLADVAVLLLVAKGIDFHIESWRGTPRTKHARSIKDLEYERVSLATKLNFMRENGLKELASVVDTELRNDIAHMRLEIRNNRVLVKGKSASELAMRNTIRINHAISTTSILLERLARKRGLVK
jgi:hypothetical protein